MSNKEKSDQSPSQIGQYTTQNTVNQTNVYTVFSGQDSSEQTVYIEQLNSTDKDQAKSFQQRITQLQELEGTSIAPILDSGTDESGKPYVVYSAENGQLLSSFLNENFQELKETAVLKIGKQLATTLQTFESASLVHLDLRPENIILKPDNTISLIGVATPHTAALENRPFSQKYLDYASPEQIDGKAPSSPSNIFSTGVILYSLFAGHAPKYQVTNWDIFSQGDDITFESLSNVSKTLNPNTYQIVRRCLGRKTWGRFENNGELLNAINNAIETIETKPVEVKKSPIPVSLPQDNRVLYGVAALIAALIVIGALALFRSRQTRSLTNFEETPAGLTTVEETTESPTNTPPPSTNTPIPLEATLLQPPEGAELNNLDQLTFAWSWPQSLRDGEQFVLIVKSGNQIVYQTEVQEPSSNSRFQHATPIDAFATRSGEYSWQAILQSSDGSTRYSSPNGTFMVVVSTPTPTATVLPTETPTLTPTITNTPEPTNTPTPEVCEPNQPPGWVSYEFKAGDLVFNLAIQTGTTVERIEEVSCVTASSLRVGDTIFLPSLPATETPIPQPTTPSDSGGGGNNGGGDGGGGGGGGNPNPPNNTPTPPGLP